MEKLNEAWVGITKTQQAAAVLQGRAVQLLDDATSKFKSTFAVLLKCMPATESLSSDLSFHVRLKSQGPTAPLSDHGTKCMGDGGVQLAGVGGFLKVG